MKKNNPAGNTETNVNSILTKDGVSNNNLWDANHTIACIPMIIQNMGEAPWSHRLVNTPTGSATLICQKPGEGNREHYHTDISEWWLIIKGEYEFVIDGKVTIANRNEIVFVPKGVKHKITAIGNVPAIRLAVSVDGAKHVYTDNDATDKPKTGYWKRLKKHPGFYLAILMTIFGFMAGASNKSFGVWWHGGLIGVLAIGVFVWGSVLLSNRK